MRRGRFASLEGRARARISGVCGNEPMVVVGNSGRLRALAVAAMRAPAYGDRAPGRRADNAATCAHVGALCTRRCVARWRSRGAAARLRALLCAAAFVQAARERRRLQRASARAKASQLSQSASSRFPVRDRPAHAAANTTAPPKRSPMLRRERRAASSAAVEIGAPDIAAVDHARATALCPRGNPARMRPVAPARGTRSMCRPATGKRGKRRMVVERRRNRWPAACDAAAVQRGIGAVECVQPSASQVQRQGGFVELHPFDADRGSFAAVRA